MVKKPFNPLSIFTVGKMESSACICGPKCAFRSNFGHFEPKNLKKKILIFSYKNGVMLPRTHIEFSRLTIFRNFKNATFYVDCFLYWVDCMLFPIQYFIFSRDKQQLTAKLILLRPFILTLSRR